MNANPRAAVATCAFLAPALVLAGCSDSSSVKGCGNNCPPPQAEFLYAYSFSSSAILAFPMNLSTGMPGAPTSIPGPASSEGVVATPSGKFLYVSDSQTDAILAFSINAAGGNLIPIGGSPFSVGNTPPLSASGLAMDPSGRFLYVTDLNAGNVAAFTINSTTGVLAAVPGSPFPAGSGAVQAAVDPSGRFLYVTLLNDSNGSIFAYTINSANGALSPVPGSPFATVANGQPQFLAVHPSGKFLYAGLDGPSAVAAFAIRANGALAPVAGSPFPTGNFPLGLAVDRAGRFLYTADTGAGTISAFAVDQNSGALSALSGSPFSAGTNSAGLARSPYAMVTDTTSKFLYVSDGSNSAMLTFNISATGALSGPSVTTSGGDPLYLTLVSVP